MSNALLREIKKCTICSDFLPCEPNPILQFKKSSKILIVGQAPGILAHNSSVPWDDKSGERLRHWLGISDDQFYDSSEIAIVPMGFCYPGKGKSGDLPPRKECAVKWMKSIRDYLTNIELEIYIGKYACDYEFGKYGTLAELVKRQYKSKEGRVVLPHPSPRNNIWLAKNSWFEQDAIPFIRKKVKLYLK
jgi:uracil-DNA glycosylase